MNKVSNIQRGMSALVSGIMIITGCSSINREGKVFLVPEGARATQVDHSFKFSNCELGQGAGMITRNTYFEINNINTPLTEVEVMDSGTCDPNKKMFFTDDELGQLEFIENDKFAQEAKQKLCEAGVLGTRDQAIQGDSEVPYEDSSWVRYCGSGEIK